MMGDLLFFLFLFFQLSFLSKYLIRQSPAAVLLQEIQWDDDGVVCCITVYVLSFVSFVVFAPVLESYG